MRNLRSLTYSIAVGCALSLQSVFSHGAVLFSDSFESGDLSKALSSAKWGGAQYVSVSKDRATDGSASAKFTFIGNSNINEDAFSELRFDLGKAVPEVWIQYQVYVPTNYQHRNASPGNNKILRLWGVNYDEQEKVGLSTWPSGGYSMLQADWNTNGDGIGPKGNGARDFFSAADLGKWVTLKIQVKAPTASQNGTMRVWKNGALVVDNNNNMNSYASSGIHAYRYGYIFGWSNSGFNETTTMYVDNVVIGTQESDLGGTTAPVSSAPVAPVLRITQ